MNFVSNEDSIKKSWIVLALAVGLAAFAAWLSSYYLNAKEEQLKASIVGGKEIKIPVIVPRVAVNPGDLVSKSNMVVREFPKKYLPDGVFKPSQFESLVGRRITRSVSPGRPLLESSISGNGIEQFSDLLDEGERAITIPMDEFNSTAGMLVAGDKIDLFLMTEKGIIQRQKGDKDVSALYLLIENATVLATGKSTLSEDSNRSIEDEFEQYNTITLGVSQKDAGRVGLAREDGKFIAMLRNREDIKRVKYKVIDDNDLYNDVAIEQQQVEFIIGGKSKNGMATIDQQKVVLEQLANKLDQMNQITHSAQVTSVNP